METNRSAVPGTATGPVLIGMVHLRALPGAPGFAGDLAAVRDAALRDARTLETGGADAILVENYFDTPLYPGRVPVETVANMTAIVAAIVETSRLPVGVNVLRNDACAALAIAHATGARFIRVNVLTGARLTDQGVVQGPAHELARLRARLEARDIRVLADVNVKHSAPIGQYDPIQEVEDCIHRGGADAVIVSGSGTGKGTAIEDVAAVRAAAGPTPMLIGSGVTVDNVAAFAPHADGFIVGTGLKLGAKIEAEVALERVQALSAAIEAFRGHRDPGAS